jgi:hypothetical protein
MKMTVHPKEGIICFLSGFGQPTGGFMTLAGKHKKSIHELFK